MKGTLRTLFFIPVVSIFFAISCNGPQDPAVQQKLIDSEVDNVVLDISHKAGMAASEVTENKIIASWYNSASYKINYSSLIGKRSYNFAGRDRCVSV